MKFNLYSKLQKIDKLFSNKLLLNFIAGISFLNIIAFVMLKETTAIIYFILLGLLTSFFSKNMGIILLVPLIIVNLLLFTSKSSLNKREGLENNSDNAADKDGKKETKKTMPTSTPSSGSNGLVVTPLDHSNTEDLHKGMDEQPVKTDVDESFEVGRNKKGNKGYNIDYASTVEDAYDELNKILGSDGIKRLTADTQNLMKQQMKLAESMKSMEPLIAGMAPIMKQAEGLLGSLGENGNMGNLANIAKQFSAGLGK
jgi:hypothetical protein